MVFGELQGSPFPYGPGQVKLPVGQVDLDRFFFFIWYKQIEEFQNSWESGKWWFWEKASPGVTMETGLEDTPRYYSC